MAADGFSIAKEILSVPQLRERNDRNAATSVRVLLDTSNAYDAERCGFSSVRAFREDGEGFTITYDGRWSVPAVTLNGIDGEVSFNGIEEIRAASEVIAQALAYAQLHGGR